VVTLNRSYLLPTIKTGTGSGWSRSLSCGILVREARREEVGSEAKPQAHADQPTGWFSPNFCQLFFLR
jgi:hypothetical protein